MSEKIKEFIRKCDNKFHSELCRVTDAVCADPNLKMIRLSGPTCAGKTTAAKMIVKRMAENGKNAVFISIDDFYYDNDYMKALSLKKGLDGVDYDSADTIDKDALRKFVDEAFNSSEAECPIFDFKQGKRVGYRKIRINEDDVFIFEGIQVVYPEIVEVFGDISTDCIFIMPSEVVTCDGVSFEPNELRLMRRIVRDYNFRNTSAEGTMELWKNVRANEDKNIFPYISTCKYVISSSMQYEIGILRPFLEKIIGAKELQGKYSDRFSEILRKVSGVEAISAEYVESDSLYREFV